MSRPQGAALPPQPCSGSSRTGRSRRVAAAVALTAVGAVALAAATGCEAADSAQVTPPYVVAIAAAETPVYYGRQSHDLRVADPRAVPGRQAHRRPAKRSSVERGAVPREPYLLNSDETVEVNYVITNLDNQTHDVWLLVDPWNEFVEWRPGVTVISDDETEPNLSGMEIPFVLNPLQRLEGNIQSSDLNTLALKLDTAMAILNATISPMAAYPVATLLNHDFNVQNTPGPSDPLLATYTPKVVAGLTGFNLGLQSYEPLNVAIEATVTVIDNSGTGKILPPGTTTGLIGAPPKVITVPGAKPGDLGIRPGPTPPAGGAGSEGRPRHMHFVRVILFVVVAPMMP